MCLIIIRDKDVVLNKEDFDVAVKNNPDGWGLSVPDGEGYLYTEKNLETDADELYELLHGEFKDSKLMLHLRYTTAGETILRNAHPFPILERGTHGIDLRMAHNGTIHKYKHNATSNRSWESDSRSFTRNFVRPLFSRMVRGHDLEYVLKDEFIYNMLEDQIPTASVLSFISGSGDTLVVNPKGNTGYYDDTGTYYSNKYSFDPTHREPKTWSSTGGWGTGKKDQANTQKPSGNGSGTKSMPSGWRKLDTLFTDEYSITDFRDLYYLSDATIANIVSDAPESAENMIKELLYRLQCSDKEINQLKQQLDSVKEKTE